MRCATKMLKKGVDPCDSQCSSPFPLDLRFCCTSQKLPGCTPRRPTRRSVAQPRHFKGPAKVRCATKIKPSKARDDEVREFLFFQISVASRSFPRLCLLLNFRSYSLLFFSQTQISSTNYLCFVNFILRRSL